MPVVGKHMLSIGDKHVYLACGHTDMRKSINGLASLVEASFKLNPHNASLYVFCNRNRDRIKILEWDTDGFWLYFKRLEQGHFKWPSEKESETTMQLTEAEFSCLLNSPKVMQKLQRKEAKMGVII
jgi:transposase